MRSKNDPKLNVLARALRRDMTKEEKRIWYDCLKKLPYTFYRQKQFGRFIVDFFCAEAALVIEIDGSQHFTESGMKSDIARDEYLNSIGLDVIRYSNNDVNTNFEGVCLDIAAQLKRRTGRG